MKQPWFQFYVGDWLRDPEVGQCSLAGRGLWIDVLCIMHEMGRTGEVTLSIGAWLRLCRCSDSEFGAALNDIECTKTADVERDGNGNVTIRCRRMQREHAERVATRERVAKHREKKDVTPSVTQMKQPSSESESESEYRVGVSSNPISGSCNGAVTTSSHTHFSQKQEEEKGTISQAENRPTLARAVEYFTKSTDYTRIEVERIWTQFENAAKRQGHPGLWHWGKMPVTDWRRDMEQRLSEWRMDHPEHPIAKTASSIISRELDGLAK